MMTRQAVNARLDDQWSAMRALVGAHIYALGATSTVAYRSADLESRYVQMLEALRHDKIVGEVTMLGLRRAPGSKDRHHAYEGGLLAHMLEMWECWQVLRDSVMFNRPPEALNDANVLRAIIHHDLNKVHKYRLVSVESTTVPEGSDEQVTIPWVVEYAKANEDPLGHALTSTHKALHYLVEYGVPLDALLHNALVTSEGGYMKDRPSTESVFAKLMYLLDELSANVFSRLSNGQFWDSKQGGLRADAL